MACFWNGILSALPPPVRSRWQANSARDIQQYLLVRRTHLRRGCRWQGRELPPREIEEAIAWIAGDAATPVDAGHLTSSCDPWLCLLAVLTKCRVRHAYAGTVLLYEPLAEACGELRFASSRSHFWAG